MTEAILLFILSITFGQWLILIGALTLCYWLGSLVGWWAFPCFRETEEDWKPLKSPVRRKDNWQLMPDDDSTVPKRIFWQPSNFEGNQNVLLGFAAQIQSGRIMKHVVKSLPDHPRARKDWLHAVKMATFLQLRPRPPFSCLGWAQATDPAIYEWYRCLLGLEKAVLKRGAFTASVCGHELVHLTQQVRARELTKEWGMPPEWESETTQHLRPPWLNAPETTAMLFWNKIWNLPLLHELSLEVEAHWRFKLTPALLSISVGALLILIQYGLQLAS